jgi:hypothetical protein
MQTNQIVDMPDSQLNAALLVTLISPTIFHDYQLKEDGLYCTFTKPITYFQYVIKAFLAALHEITNRQFYFDIISNQQAILKIYGIDNLRFSQDILFDKSLSSKGEENKL